MRILYIDIDTLRPDHLGCYGYPRKTSPAIDAIAREGVLVRHCYTPDAPCLPSRTALYSGRFGIQTGVVGHGGTAAQPKIEGPSRDFRDNFDTHGLAQRLQRLGFHTAMVSPFGQRHSAHWFYAGFHEMHNTGGGGMESAEEVMPVVHKWLETNGKNDQWFLHVNIWDPHTPYRAPASLGEPFQNDPIPQWLDDENLIAKHKALVGPHTALDFGGMYDERTDPKWPRHPGKIENRRDMRRVIDGYDTGILYADMQVANIVAQLKRAGVYDETAIVISSDHGENFGELGLYGEHATADEGTCRIPLLIKWPGAAKGAVLEGFHYNLDLGPTLMDLLGGQKSPLWSGKSFAHAVQTGTGRGREEVILSQCAHVCQRSVRFGKWLYVRTYHDGFHLWPDEMLFDMAQNPHEQDNVAAEFPEVVCEGAWRLARWHGEQMHLMSRTAVNVEDPLWKVMSEGGPHHARFARNGQPCGGQGLMGFEKYLERLEKTGRGEGARVLKEKYQSMILSAQAKGL